MFYLDLYFVVSNKSRTFVLQTMRVCKGDFFSLQVEKNNPQNFLAMTVKWILKVWVFRLEINLTVK